METLRRISADEVQRQVAVSVLIGSTQNMTGGRGNGKALQSGTCKSKLKPEPGLPFQILCSRNTCKASEKFTEQRDRKWPVCAHNKRSHAPKSKLLSPDEPRCSGSSNVPCGPLASEGTERGSMPNRSSISRGKKETALAVAGMPRTSCARSQIRRDSAGCPHSPPARGHQRQRLASA